MEAPYFLKAGVYETNFKNFMIIIIIIYHLHRVFTNIPGTNHVSGVYNVSALLWLQCMVYVMLFYIVIIIIIIIIMFLNFARCLIFWKELKVCTIKKPPKCYRLIYRRLPPTSH
jgi:hypothetical protein